jgi:ribosomal protein S28E/S33
MKSTKPVEVYHDNIAQKNWVSGRIRTGGEGEVHGLRARIYMKMPSGKEVMREVTYPQKLSEEKFPWKN